MHDVVSQIELALALWSRGLSIIPVPRPDGHGLDGKVPVIAWREYQTRRPSEREIHAWFDGRGSNIAIITARCPASWSSMSTLGQQWNGPSSGSRIRRGRPGRVAAITSTTNIPASEYRIARGSRRAMAVWRWTSAATADT